MITLNLKQLYNSLAAQKPIYTYDFPKLEDDPVVQALKPTQFYNSSPLTWKTLKRMAKPVVRNIMTNFPFNKR